MKTDREITLEYLIRFKEDIEGCLYAIDKDADEEIYDGVVSEIECIKTTIKIIEELEVE